jgi:hypothetical protein
MAKQRIWVSWSGSGRTLYIELSVFRAGKTGLTIACPDDKEFKFGTSDEQLRKFRDKLQRLFAEHVEGRPVG